MCPPLHRTIQASVEAAARSTNHAVGPALPTIPIRLPAGLFGVIALVLAAIGLYGVTAYSVARRTSEIGVRMALGADRGRVLRLVLGGAFRRVAIRLALGLPLVVGAGYLLSAQLYGVSSWDPTALGVAAVALALSAFVASLVPAIRAAALAPIRALRIE